MNAAKAMSIFANSSQPKKVEMSKDNLNYKKLNESLTKKILQTKTQLVQSEKCIEKLREENMQLRQVNQKLLNATDDEKIEMIVAQRIKSKLKAFASISQKTIQFLQNASTDMNEALMDVQSEIPEKTANVRKESKKLALKPLLEKVVESPIKRAKHSEATTSEVVTIGDEESDENENKEEKQETTPKMTIEAERQRANRRRSALLDIRSYDQETPKAPPVPAAVPKRGPICIQPKTPGVEVKVEQPKSHRRKAKKSDPDGFVIPLTPDVMNSVRNGRLQRSAKLKVSSMKEVSLGAKLRRPGKYDEPVPFIDRFSYN